MVRVRVPATSANLGPGLDVLGLAIDLHSSVEIAEGSELSIEHYGLGQGEVPLSPENLVYRAACRVFDDAGRHPKNIRLRFHNRIPLARGLGSSSAAIVGGMVAADALLGVIFGPGARLGSERILHLAAEMEGHPDNVAPALLGGVTVAVGSPGNVSFHHFIPPGRLRLVLAIPEFPLATSQARKCIPQTVDVRDAVYNVGRSALMVAALMAGRWDLLPEACRDRLHQPFRAGLIPGFEEVLEAARDSGAAAVALSGAGPSILAIVDGERRGPDGGPRAPLVARAMAEVFLDHGVDCRTLIAGIAPRGAIIEPDSESTVS